MLQYQATLTPDHGLFSLRPMTITRGKAFLQQYKKIALHETDVLHWRQMLIGQGHMTNGMHAPSQSHSFLVKS